MKTWTFYWLTGEREVLKGKTAADALNRAGVGRGALPALDFHAEGDEDDYVWNATERTWEKKEN